MLARRCDGVAGGKFLNHLDVGDEAGPRKYAFQQIVAEDRTFRNLSLQRGRYSVDFVDSFAAIGTLFEQILVNVGDCERIGVEPIWARKGALEQRSFATDRQ